MSSARKHGDRALPLCLIIDSTPRLFPCFCTEYGSGLREESPQCRSFRVQTSFAAGRQVRAGRISLSPPAIALYGSLTQEPTRLFRLHTSYGKVGNAIAEADFTRVARVATVIPQTEIPPSNESNTRPVYLWEIAIARLTSSRF